MFKHVLIPTDGSDASQKAARGGIAFAKAIGARTTSYYALEEHQPIYSARFRQDLEMNKQFEERARLEGQKQVGAITRIAQTAGVRNENVVAKAATLYKGIISTAKQRKCDVIFMASHGRDSISRLVMGSVTQKVLAHSKIPVLIYC